MAQTGQVHTESSRLILRGTPTALVEAGLRESVWRRRRYIRLGSTAHGLHHRQNAVIRGKRGLL